MKKFDRLRIDRDNYLNVLIQYQNLYNIVSVDRDELININVELDEIRKKMNTLKTNYEQTRDRFLVKQHDYIFLKKDHDVLLVTTRDRTRDFDNDDENNDDEINVINFFNKNKRRSKIHSNFSKFIDEMKFI